MALPKRRHSRARVGNRRCRYRARTLALANCPQCGATVLAHNACRKCGYYQQEKVDHTVKEEQKT
ncbi:MAG: 50S ribosomal protein L32 [Armatimonadetes bacterium]|nr:50S ribosomal protein L32 [Armatimonadota bacterium]